MPYEFYLPTKLLYGAGCLSALGGCALPGRKALLVTSAGQSAKRHGYLGRVEEQLTQAGVRAVLYDQITPNPTKAEVMAGAALCRKEGCDFVLGLGGGSSIDAAKAISVMARNPGDYWDYVSGGTGGGKAVPVTPLPIVAITTTAGTGTEADPWAVITNPEGEKIGFGYDGTFPVLSIVDPDLMMSVPEKLTAYQGFDALFHSTEGYINRYTNPINDLYALKAIELIGKSLAKAVNNGSDKEAREDVALANTLSGMSESIGGCTSEHAMEHPLSGKNPKLEHGAGLIMLCEAYYTYWAERGVIDDRMIAMAKALGKTDATKPMDFVDALHDLKVACHVDDLKMSDYGIKEEDLEMYTKMAYDTMGGLFKVDPADMPFEDCLAIYKKAYR